MFGDLTHLALQQYWFIIVSFLGALLVFLFFVQGGQTFLSQIGKTEMERTILVNALGRKWEFTFTTLVTFGGAFFASFPLFYATSFGGAYWVWMIILFAFVIQAVSYEFRTKAGNFLGKRVYESFLYINGLLGTLLVGVAVATFFSGSRFALDEMNSVHWATEAHGLEAALSPFNLSLGLAVFFLARVLGLLYFMNTIDHENILARSRKALLGNALAFVCFFLVFAIWLMLREGFAVNPNSGEIYMEPYKYLHNLLAMPVVLGIFLAGVLAVLGGIILSLPKASPYGIWFTGPGTVMVVFALFLLAGFNNTAFYPSVHDLQSSLTIENASSSHYTLVAMSWVSLFIPFVMAYIVFAWRAMNKKKIDEKEMEEEPHVY
jgi:cytochrome d ubiquinol oxidase subunit II